jgi:metallo-beta-lactamase class B
LKRFSKVLKPAATRGDGVAGNDLQPLLRLCEPQPATRISGEALDKAMEQALALPAPEPGRAFDNLDFFASGFVSAWALDTSDGIILIDAMDNEREARHLIEGGMQKMGLDPRRIRWIVVTHAHGDHYGGVPYLAAKYKARVISSEADWQQIGGTLEFPSRTSPPRRRGT